VPLIFHTHRPSSQILFLNKIDLFAEKLPRSPLSDYFPDYQGGDNYDAACDYLLHRFVSLNQSAATKQIYAHYTCATDTQQIKCTFSLSSVLLLLPTSAFCLFAATYTDPSLLAVVLSAIQDILLQLHLRECGLL
jgi:guanine nucleotide-binding protein G(i) subunit alpha